MYVSFTVQFMLSEIRSLTEPGAHHFEKTVRLENPRTHLLGLQMCDTIPRFYVGPGDLNVGSYACLISILPTDSLLPSW